jgi:predicted AlkP superfamily pyrophosphatase or phosphodiesterase
LEDVKILVLCVLNGLLFAGMCVAKQPSKRPALAVVLVIDGLRPDSITPDVMPNLDRIKRNGVWYRNAHSVFPTVTRVNAASISTGTLPFHHGIVSNALYLPDISKALLNDGDYRTLVTMGKRNGGRVVGPKTIAEYFQEAGIRYVAVSSGSTGSAFLLNPMAPAGIGTLINTGLEDGRQVAFPEVQSSAILSRFGPVKADSGGVPVVWTERVLRDYIFGTLHPQVLVDWLGQPDEAQHAFGVGSPEALAALRLVDQQVGLLLERLREIGLEGKTDLIVTCDHGFDYEPPMDTLAPMRDAGLRAGDVVVDNEGGTSLLYVRDRAREKIKRLVTRLQASESTNAIFVAARAPTGGQIQCSPGAVKGFLPGTLALDFIYQCLPSHGPDIIVTYRWEEKANPFGVPGTQWVPGTLAAGQTTAHSGHGALNPYATHSTLMASGPDFEQHKTIDLPAGNQDIAPTLLALEGLPVPASMDGRVLAEAMKGHANGRTAHAVAKRVEARTGTYCAEIEVSELGHRRYLDQARRCAVQ